VRHGATRARRRGRGRVRHSIDRSRESGRRSIDARVARCGQRVVVVSE
jgi:hypothetical protein